LCEGILKSAGTPQYQLGFLMGLFSLLDALIDLPLEEALMQINLAPELKGALLGTAPENDPFRTVFDLVRRYEAGDWDAVAPLAARLNVRVSAVIEAYAAATLWSMRSMRATSRVTEARRNVRHAASGALRILWEDPAGRDRVSNARLKNISANGLQLEVNEQLPVRTYVTCNDAKLGIAGRGMVRYCNHFKGKYLIGIEFSGGTGWREPQ
jgi:hypothetical protein